LKRIGQPLYDAWGAVRTTVYYDEETDTMAHHHEQDVEAIVENNKRLQNLNDGYSPSRELKRVGSIPLQVAEKWRIEAGLGVEFWQWPKKEQNAFFLKRLRSSDNRHFRTADKI